MVEKDARFSIKHYTDLSWPSGIPMVLIVLSKQPANSIKAGQPMRAEGGLEMLTAAFK